VGEQHFSDYSALRRFLTISRQFGLSVAMKITYSKVRGRLRPNLALPKEPVYSMGQRQVSILLSTVEQSVSTFNAVVDGIARRSTADWELCICACYPLPPEMAPTLARLRGTRPWIRIVTTGESVAEGVAARWTAEQATGQFIAVVAPGYALEPEAVTRLLDVLRDDRTKDAAVLLATESGSSGVPPGVARTNCRLLLEKKSQFLTALPCLLSAPAVARHLEEAGIPTAFIAA
jgi:hypothetical protein